jgi:sugar phosphate isomerase/epimerase
MDTAMPILAGGDSVDDCRTYIDRIVYNGYMHIKDAKEDLRSKRDLWGRSKVQFFYELGTGKVDFPAIAKELKRANFNGWLTVECDDQMLVDPYKTARTNVKYLEDVIKKILPGPVRKPASFGYSALEIQHGPSAR